MGLSALYKALWQWLLVYDFGPSAGNWLIPHTRLKCVFPRTFTHTSGWRWQLPWRGLRGSGRILDGTVRPARRSPRRVGAALTAGVLTSVLQMCVVQLEAMQGLGARSP